MKKIILLVCLMAALPTDGRSDTAAYSAAGYGYAPPPSYFDPRSPSAYSHPMPPSRSGLSPGEYDRRLRDYDIERNNVDRNRAERDRGQREYLRRQDEAAREYDTLQRRQQQARERDALDLRRRDDGMSLRGGTPPRQGGRTAETPGSYVVPGNAPVQSRPKITPPQGITSGPFAPGQLQPNQPVPDLLAPSTPAQNMPRKSDRVKTK